MEDFAKPAALNHEMVQTLDEIRAGAENALYGATSTQADSGDSLPDYCLLNPVYYPRGSQDGGVSSRPQA